MKHSKTYTDVKNIPNIFEKINRMDNLGIINAKVTQEEIEKIPVTFEETEL